MMTNDYLEQNEIVRHSCHCGKEYKNRTSWLKHNTKCGLPNDNEKKHKCECGKIYSHRQGLYAHKKMCADKIKQPNSQTSIPTNDLTNLVVELMKSNNELQKQNSELQKQSQDFQKQLLEICTIICS